MRALYDSKTLTMDDRGIRKLFTKETKYESWLKLETALAKAQAEYGIIPKEAADEIEKAAKLENIDLIEMEKIFQEIGHGFVPFLKVLVKACPGDSGKYIHYGLTTQNIQQSAQLLVTKQIHQKFMELTADILHNLSKLAYEHKDSVMPGRTHGRHATPITYGYKVSVWISDFLNCAERMREAEKRVFTIMMGGAVGTFSTMGETGLKIQKRVAEILDMEPMLVPSRNITAHKTEYIMNLALLANACHKIGEEVYSTTLEEIGEVSESFKDGTVGSSTMPHKINPKLAKGIIANSQKLYSLIPVGMYSGARPYEGDSSSYMLFDGLLEEALELMTEILLRCEELTGTLSPHKEKLLSNANMNKGLDNSEFIMMKLSETLGKDKAHELVYKIAIKTAKDGEDFYKNLIADPLISKHFSDEDIKFMIDPRNYTGLSEQTAVNLSRIADETADKIKKQNAGK